MWSRQLGPLSEQLVAALVCQIFEGAAPLLLCSDSPPPSSSSSSSLSSSSYHQSHRHTGCSPLVAWRKLAEVAQPHRL